MFKRLLILNGIAALGVVVNHAAGWGFRAMFDWTHRYREVQVPNYDELGSITYYILLWTRQLASIDIPAFLVVSGFFVAFTVGANQSNVKWKVIFARIKNLAAPFIIWTLIRLILLQRIPSSYEDIIRPYYYIILIAQYYLLAWFLNQHLAEV